MIPDLREQGLSNLEIRQARIRLHQMNENLTGEINERFGTNITY
ncbi:MAG: Unknown protein [uncultured Sulfurovum sp.]|uniref:Uncharacterized protein n=1 Tax=uncultured Sulfurovum sp. TaxID=269237 RepID=A0A6S6TL10_9BACT|nr:MAG: Unknown protein [uncultured Sulfurovum sp.]